MSKMTENERVERGKGSGELLSGKRGEEKEKKKDGGRGVRA